VVRNTTTWTSLVILRVNLNFSCCEHIEDLFNRGLLDGVEINVQCFFILFKRTKYFSNRNGLGFQLESEEGLEMLNNAELTKSLTDKVLQLLTKPFHYAILCNLFN
jgi:hypothetical protein